MSLSFWNTTGKQTAHIAFHSPLISHIWHHLMALRQWGGTLHARSSGLDAMTRVKKSHKHLDGH